MNGMDSFYPAERSEPLRRLVSALEAQAPSILVVDMVEEGLSAETQVAFMRHLRSTKQQKRAIFLMTRSTAILDLELVGTRETVIVCPANHSPPIHVVPCPGGRGYEAAATCLASPEARARTAGVVAIRQSVAG